MGIVSFAPHHSCCRVRVGVHRSDTRGGAEAPLEQSSDPKTIIVTLATPDGFEVSFGLTRQQMMVFDAAVEAVERKVPDTQTLIFS